MNIREGIKTGVIKITDPETNEVDNFIVNEKIICQGCGFKGTFGDLIEDGEIRCPHCNTIGWCFD
jgi:DNA-directed RNA polymerase subunit RPC12/RpoP